MRFLPVVGLLALGAALAAGEALAQEDSAARDYISRLPPSQEVAGILAEGPGGRFFLIPSAKPGLRIPISEGQVFPESARDVPLSLRIKPGSGNQSVTVQSLTLEALAVWAAESRNLPVSGDLTSAMETLKVAADTALHIDTRGAVTETPGEHRAADAELSENLIATEEQLVDEYLRTLAAARSNLSRRDKLLAVFKKFRRDTKAIYGRPDFYSPQNYLQIHQSSKSGVAIAVTDLAEIKCSGVIIGPDLVLTARHCLSSYLAEELEVWTGHEEVDGTIRSTGKFPISAPVIEGRALEDGAAKLDYIVLRVGPSGDGRRIADLAPPRCLSMSRLNRDQPIYVVGHPEGRARTIHDNAWILFPFAATRLEYGRLLMLVEAEFKDSPEREQWVSGFLESYRPMGNLYRHYSTRWGRQPIMTAEADTFHGDSGAPVFDRLSHKLVGIIFAGEPDVLEPWQPGWRRNEALIPASQVFEDIQTRAPTLLDSIQRC